MYLRNLNIGNKLALILTALSLVVATLLSSMFFVQFEAALKERVLLQLSSVKQLKIAKIKSELSDRLLAFKEIMNDTTRTSIETNSGLFEVVGFTNHLPDSISRLVSMDDLSQSIRMFDLTSININQSITICLVGRVDEQYLIAATTLPELQEILLERTGLGQTGESYLVGEDYRLRSRSRFDVENSRTIEVRTEGVSRAMSGNPGQDVFLDYRGKEVFSSYEKIEELGLTWVILSEIDYKEALAPLNKLKSRLLYILLFIISLILVISYFLSKMLVRPILSMEKKLMRMSRGVLDSVSSPIKREDEIGSMFEALNKLVNALNEMISFAGQIGEGNFDAKYESLSPDDKLGEALVKMKGKLRTYKDNEERLLKENQKSILNGVEQERARLSKEMHDGIGPLLTTLKMNLQTAELKHETKNLLLKRLDETITEVRRISNNLMPSVLEDFGAGEAIGNFIEQVRESHGICIKFKNDMSIESDIDSPIQILLYRIAQESISNAIKHSKASEIRVSITEFPDHLSFFISDNGTGFNISRPNTGNGIRNMKERVKVVNGTIDIMSNSKGTSIEVDIPLI